MTCAGTHLATSVGVDAAALEEFRELPVRHRPPLLAQHLTQLRWVQVAAAVPVGLGEGRVHGQPPPEVDIRLQPQLVEEHRRRPLVRVGERRGAPQETCA